MSDDDDRLPLPPEVDWPIFPFEGEMRVREIQPRFPTERVRDGDPGGDPCYRCEGDNAGTEPVWANERWAVRPLHFNGRPAPFPAYMLEAVEHLDMEDLTEEMAAEMGVLTLRLNHAILAIGTVGRVHVNRWGDGSAHFHLWFLGRPTGAWQFSGYTLPLWGFTLPGLPVEALDANHEVVAAHLAAAAQA